MNSISLPYPYGDWYRPLNCIGMVIWLVQAARLPTLWKMKFQAR